MNAVLNKVKAKIAEWSVYVAAVLAAVQIMLPMFFDLVFDAMIIGLVWLASKQAPKQ